MLLFFLLNSYSAIAEKSPCSSCTEKCPPTEKSICVSGNSNSSNSEKSLQNSQQSPEASPAKSSDDDEFETFSQEELIQTDSTNTDQSVQAPVNQEFSLWQFLQVPLIALMATLLASVFVRFAPTRKLQYLFLISSIVYLGFYNGACPCPISSFSNTILGVTGTEINWRHTLWFLALIPLTYIFGKTWCGWVCHLGALQEFLFKTNKWNALRSGSAQKAMKIIRIILLATLIIQLIATKTYLFNEIDPFRIIYNLGLGAGPFGLILTGLIVFTSVFIYRPFCKSACPIGLVLGLVSYIPGASVLGSSKKCIGCKIGSDACRMDALQRKDNSSIIVNSDCIACGDCLEACPKDGLAYKRKSSNNPSIANVCNK